MSYQVVKKFFEEKGYKNRIILHEKMTETVASAANLLGCSEAEIAKTMTFLVNDQPIAIVMTGDVKVSNSKYKTYFGVKAKMISSENVEEIIGHEPGGVCPFKVNEGVKVYLDNSLKKFKYVYAAGGSKDTTVGLKIEELEDLSNYIEWIDVTQEK